MSKSVLTPLTEKPRRGRPPGTPSPNRGKTPNYNQVERLLDEVAELRAELARAEALAAKLDDLALCPKCAAQLALALVQPR